MGKRERGRRGAPLAGKSFVTVRPQAFAFSAGFATKAGLHQYARVTIDFDSEDRRVFFVFHNNEDDVDSYPLTRDGGQGGKNTRGRATQVTALMNRLRWVKKVGQSGESRHRRFEPKWDAVEGAWCIRLCPAFEEKAAAVDGIPSETRGLYRLRDGDEIVYIGQGAPIRSRVRDHEKDGWVFDRVEYSPVEDAKARAEWESQWIRQYKDEQGRLPRYNRIGGRSGAKE